MLIGVLTSGGDAPGMNAAVRAVVRTTIFRGHQVIGIRRGLHGLLQNDMVLMDTSSVADIIYRGGTILLTGRSEEFRTVEGQRRAVSILRDNAIDSLVLVGGDGTVRAARAIEDAGVPAICIPGTIDNDIPFSDTSIGFDTAVNTICDAVDKVRDTAESLERTFIVEVMGRSSGFLALASGVACGAESIMVPEYGIDYERICRRLRNSIARRKRHSIIILAEGAGDAPAVSAEIRRRTGYDLRVITLGHIQRGGTPTAQDRVLASMLGYRAVELLIQGTHGKLVGWENGKISEVDLGKAADSRKPLNKESFEIAEVLSAT
jgi:6-phosphofructokinase 1